MCLNNPPNPSCSATNMEWWAWGRDPSLPACSGFSSRVPTPARISTSRSTKSFAVVRTSSQWQVWRAGVIAETLSLASICWAPNRGDWTGESWDKGDAIGGYGTNHFELTSAIYESTVGGVWASPGFPAGSETCNLTPTLSKFHCSASSNSISLWTVVGT
jgi:hypothetical protein